MTREEFIRVLNQERYPYSIVGDKLVITKGDFRRDEDDIDLPIAEIPENISFNNRGTVSLNFIKKVPSGVEFNNVYRVLMARVISIHPSVRFNTRGSNFLGDLVDQWDGNIEGIDENALFNMMIKRGLFI